MADNVGTVKNVTDRVKIVTGVNGLADNQEVIVINDIHDYDLHVLSSSTGSLDVYVSLNGVTFTTTPLALRDLQSTAPGTYVTATTAGGAYSFSGNFDVIKVLQANVGTAAASVLHSSKT